MREYRLKKIFGISADEYEFRLALQGSMCAICAEEMEMPHLDHNHTTGKLREFLCFRCNTMIGMARENLEVLTSAMAYLEKHQ